MSGEVKKKAMGVDITPTRLSGTEKKREILFRSLNVIKNRAAGR